MTDDRLSGLDTAFLCLDSPEAPMHLGALAVFEPDRPVPPERLVAVLSDRAERLAPLRRRVRPAWLAPVGDSWVEDERFHVGRHVRVHAVDDRDLATRAGELMAEPLDLNRPLWQLHVFTGLPGNRFAVLVKMHHALVDGLRAVQLGMGLLDGAPEPAAAGDPPRPQPGLSLAERVGAAAGLVTRPDRLAGALVSGLVSGLAGAARQAVDVAGLATSVLSGARPAAPGWPLGAGSTAQRGLELLRLDAAEIRQVRRRFGGTDNDVLLAVLTGALRRWLVGRGDRTDRPGPRALIPVSRRTRPPGRPTGGNLLSGYLCELPVHEPDPRSQLAEIRGTMDRNKAVGPVRGAGAVPLLADRVPALVHRVATPFARRGAGLLFDTVVTNVPIPTLPLTLDGAALRDVYPIVPLAHGQGLGVALSTYRGTVHIGLHADRAALPDLPRLAEEVPAALASLRSA